MLTLDVECRVKLLGARGAAVSFGWGDGICTGLDAGRDLAHRLSGNFVLTGKLLWLE